MAGLLTNRAEEIGSALVGTGRRWRGRLRKIKLSGCRGHTLAEVTVAMGVSAIVSTGFFQVFQLLDNQFEQQRIVSTYQDNIRTTLRQIAKEVRLAGANPTGNPDLFDGDPEGDALIDLDPDLDGDITNAVLIRADRRGTDEGEADGDIDDSVETIMYHHDVQNARLMRHVWRVPPEQSGIETTEHEANQAQYDAMPFQEGICSFKLTYYDRTDEPTTDPDEVASIGVEMSSASGPEDCGKSHSYTRSLYVLVRIRNR